MINNNSRRRKEQPLYIQISEELREEILDGIFADDEKLPSVKDLAEKLSVSRSTLREAIGILERDGLVKRIHGVGTIITRSHISLKSGQDRLISFTDISKSRGIEPATSFKKMTWEIANDELTEKLGITKGSKVAVIERVRTGDGKPMVYLVDKMPIDVIGSDFNIDKMGESLFEYLRNVRGIVFKYSSLEIRAAGVDEDIAKYLDLKPDYPVLSFEDVIYDNEQKPVLYSINIYRTDRYYYEMERKF